MMFKNKYKIVRKKDGEIFTVLGVEGCFFILKPKKGKVFSQSINSVERDYTNLGE